MPNMLEQASNWLSDQLDEHASSSVEFRRGSLSVSLVAGKARTTFDAVDSNGMVINVESSDFIITASTIVLDEVATLPRVGDLITESIGSETHAFEVMRFGTEQCFRQCDPYGHKLRIHTKYVGVI
jgi:hypothetical protein